MILYLLKMKNKIENCFSNCNPYEVHNSEQNEDRDSLRLIESQFSGNTQKKSVLILHKEQRSHESILLVCFFFLIQGFPGV